MDGWRQQLQIDATGKIEITFYTQGEQNDLKAAFRCTSCETLLDWHPDRSWWNCSECGYCMTGVEAVRLACRMDTAIRELTGTQKGHGRWRWLTFFKKFARTRR